jgi:primosomal protein N' (replication factor Y)
MARLVARGAADSAVMAFLKDVADAIGACAEPGVRLLGPAPAPVEKIKNLYRFHLQLRAGSARPIQNVLHAVLPNLTPPQGVELAVDVDPISLL